MVVLVIVMVVLVIVMVVLVIGTTGVNWCAFGVSYRYNVTSACR